MYTSARKVRRLIKAYFIKKSNEANFKSWKTSKALKTGTEKEVELPNLSSPPIQLEEKTWKIYAIAAEEG